MSPIDKLFEQIFGEKPSKAGTAYEMIACIAEHIVNGEKVSHDKKVRGAFSNTLYQVDVLSGENDSLKMGEVKDYTIQGKKVGRGDLQKLGGALPDLSEVKSGKFFSATGYTSPAIKYAQNADKFLGGKGIELYELRPSTELDEEGTIKTICINMKFYNPLTDQASWTPHLSERGKESLRSLKDADGYVKYKAKIEEFFDVDGNNTTSIYELTSLGFGEVHRDTGCSHASYVLSGNYVKIKGILAEMNGIEYSMPYSISEQTFEITNDEESRFILKDIGGNILSFFNDEMLRKYSFDEDGRLVTPEQPLG